MISRYRVRSGGGEFHGERLQVGGKKPNNHQMIIIISAVRGGL